MISCGYIWGWRSREDGARRCSQTKKRGSVPTSAPAEYQGVADEVPTSGAAAGCNTGSEIPRFHPFISDFCLDPDDDNLTGQSGNVSRILTTDNRLPAGWWLLPAAILSLGVLAWVVM